MSAVELEENVCYHEFKVVCSMNNRVKIGEDNPAIQRIEEKCINCGVCLNTCENKLGLNRQCRLDSGKTCVFCGQCVLTCPMGALKEKYSYKSVLNILNDTDKVVTISIAPAVRVSLGEELGISDSKVMEELLPSIFRKMGFSYVFDVTFGADVTIMEEASELVNRLRLGGALPMFTSCCPSWVRYLKMEHPELVQNLSTTKSPIGIISSLIKSYFKDMDGIEKDIISVVVAPCTAKKWEIINTDTDYVITTRELALMIKELEIDIPSLKPSKFDILLGEGSKMGLLFGRSGGVMESALATVNYLLTGNTVEEGHFNVEAENGLGEASFKIGEKIIKVAVVSGLANINKIIKEKEKYDFIEVMNCQGGCVGGGGQPLTVNKEADLRLSERTSKLESHEERSIYPYENLAIKELYKSFLISPNSEIAENLLHNAHNF